VTRWITPSLGTGPFALAGQTGDAVVVDVRFLLDRAGNKPEVVGRVIDDALQWLRSGRRVLICCDHGISRSNAVAAGVLSRWEGVPFATALRRVLDATGGAELRVDVLDTVRRALGATDAAPRPGRWLATGGHGALGRALAARVPAAAELVRPARAELDLRQGTAPLDLLVREERIAGIVHLAAPAIGNVNSSVGDALVMLRNVMDVAAVHQLPVLLPSRWEVFAGYEGELRADEGTPPRPAGVMGDAKFLAETLIEQYGRRGVPVMVLRSGLVFGDSAAPPFLKSFLARARAGAEIVTHRLENGAPRLDLLGAEDWAAAAWSLMAAGRTGTFHGGGGALLGTDEIARMVVAAVESASPVRTVDVEGRAASVLLESGRLRSVTGWSPTRGPHEGLAAWARSALAAPANRERRSP
jgi:UDP-glucuronate decarboxylase